MRDQVDHSDNDENDDVKRNATHPIFRRRIGKQIEIQGEDDGESREHGADDEGKDASQNDKAEFGSIEGKEATPFGVRSKRHARCISRITDLNEVRRE